MNLYLDVIATIASIVSIPLAIYFYFRTTKITSDKARNDIIRTLSFMMGAATDLTKEIIESVYNSKLREHKIKRPDFKKKDILDDLKSEVMSNPFLDIQKRNQILNQLSNLNFDEDNKFFSTKFGKTFYMIMESPFFLMSIFLTIALLIIRCIKLIPNFIYLYDEYSLYKEHDYEHLYILLHHKPLFVHVMVLFILLSIYFSYKLYKKRNMN